MASGSNNINKIRIIWIYTGSLATAMDAATWLETVAQLRNNGLQITLVAVGPDGPCQISGVEVLCISRPEIYLIRQLVFHLKVLHLLLRKFSDSDIILFHELSAPWLLPLRVLRYSLIMKRPLLVMDTRTLPMSSPKHEKPKDKIRRMALVFMSRLGNYFSDGRLAITPRMAEAVKIPENKLWGTWPSGVQLDLFDASQKSRSWPQKNDPIRLIYAGTLNYERNLMDLCLAVEQANKKGEAFELWLLGEGNEKPDLEKFASRTDNRVRVLAAVPHSQVPYYLAQAHVGVLPFKDEKKFRVSSPIKLFEYMAAGMPILATRIQCHTDVIGNGSFVFWSESSDQSDLVEALHNTWRVKAGLQDMGSEAAVAAQTWTWRESALKLQRSLDAGLKGVL